MAFYDNCLATSALDSSDSGIVAGLNRQGYNTIRPPNLRNRRSWALWLLGPTASDHCASGTGELAPPSRGSRDRRVGPELRHSGFNKNQVVGDGLEMKAALVDDLNFKGERQQHDLQIVPISVQ